MKTLIAIIVILIAMVWWQAYQVYETDKRLDKIISAMQRENKIIGGE